MVAREEHLVGQDPVDVGPLQFDGGRPGTLHTDAQDAEDPIAGPEIHGLQR